MNKENFQKLIKQFSEKPESVCMAFHMNNYPRECGTVGCISGWAASYNAKENSRSYHEYRDTDKAASEWLGISRDDCEQLFYPNMEGIWGDYCEEAGVERSYDGDEDDESIDYRDIPPSVVIRILTELVEGKLTLEDLK